MNAVPISSRVTNVTQQPNLQVPYSALPQQPIFGNFVPSFSPHLIPPSRPQQPQTFAVPPPQQPIIGNNFTSLPPNPLLSPPMPQIISVPSVYLLQPINVCYPPLMPLGFSVAPNTQQQQQQQQLQQQQLQQQQLQQQQQQQLQQQQLQQQQLQQQQLQQQQQQLQLQLQQQQQLQQQIQQQLQTTKKRKLSIIEGSVESSRDKRQKLTVSDLDSKIPIFETILSQESIYFDNRSPQLLSMLNNERNNDWNTINKTVVEVVHSLLTDSTFTATTFQQMLETNTSARFRCCAVNIILGVYLLLFQKNESKLMTMLPCKGIIANRSNQTAHLYLKKEAIPGIINLEGKSLSVLFGNTKVEARVVATNNRNSWFWQFKCTVPNRPAGKVEVQLLIDETPLNQTVEFCYEEDVTSATTTTTATTSTSAAVAASATTTATTSTSASASATASASTTTSTAPREVIVVTDEDEDDVIDLNID